jgi:predicted NBD/HSP70 family sugar kinase
MHRDAVYIELSRGIGAGLIIDGRLHRGSNGTAGEIGHVPVAADGAMCRCGNRGCLELVAGTDAITRLVADRFDVQPDIGQVIARAEAGDPICRRALRDTGSRIGVVLGKICNLLNPTVIVIGGELVDGWSVMEPAVREALDRSAIHPAIDHLTITPSTLGARGRLLGGLALVLEDPTRFPLATLPAGRRAPSH